VDFGATLREHFGNAGAGMHAFAIEQ